MGEAEDLEIFTLKVDFIVKHPFDLPDAPPEFPADYYQGALDKLLARRTILTASDWAKSSNSKSFRPPDAQDKEAVRRAAAQAHAHIHGQILPELFKDLTEYHVLSEELETVRFACVSGRVRIVIAAGTIAATMSAGIFGAMATNYFDRPNYSADCSMHVSSPEAVSHQFLLQLERGNDQLLNENNASCVALRQKLLSTADAYEGRIDGIYGDLTARAELDYANAHGLAATDLEGLYENISNTILTPKPKRRGRR